MTLLHPIKCNAVKLYIWVHTSFIFLITCVAFGSYMLVEWQRIGKLGLKCVYRLMMFTGQSIFNAMCSFHIQVHMLSAVGISGRTCLFYLPTYSN